MTRFVECAACAAKSGSPVLCAGCLRNRATIAQLETELAEALSHEGAKDLALEELEEHDYLACNCVYQVLIALDDEVDQSKPVDLTVIPHRVLALRRRSFQSQSHSEQS